MTPALDLVRQRIAECWPEATDLDVSPSAAGALITMTIDGRWQWFDVTLDGPLLEHLLSRPKPAPKPAPVPVPGDPGPMPSR